MSSNSNQENLNEQDFLDYVPAKEKDNQEKSNKISKAQSEEQEKEPESFQAALTELKEIVDNLENTQGNLDKSVSYFRRGIYLSKWSEKYLDQMEEQITEIIAENLPE